MSECIACGQDGPSLLRRYSELIASYGYTTIAVMADTGNQKPPFSYTVGLQHTFDHPELIVFGMPPRNAHTLIGILVDRFIKVGSVVPLDEPIEQVLCKFPVVVKAVPPWTAQLHTYQATAWYQLTGRTYETQQVVLPDIRGRFPWNADFDRHMEIFQPRLYPLGQPWRSPLEPRVNSRAARTDHNAPSEDHSLKEKDND